MTESVIAVIAVLVCIAILIGLALLLREVTCWYWKINEAITLLKNINASLSAKKR
jgi:ABC-type uncharacterized transport system permease subunit